MTLNIVSSAYQFISLSEGGKDAPKLLLPQCNRTKNYESSMPCAATLADPVYFPIRNYQQIDEADLQYPIFAFRVKTWKLTIWYQVGTVC